MAFLPSSEDQTTAQDTTNQNLATPVIPTLQGTSGPSGSSGTGTQAGTTNTASPGASPSAPWQNITTYLQANAPQSANVANTISNNLTSNYQNIASQIPQTQQNFMGQINAGTVNEDQNVVNSAAVNPTQFVQDPNNVTAFQKMLNANYSGPADFSHSSDFSNLQNQVLQGQNNAALANQGTTGFQTLLQGAEGNPTAGETALDSLLMQENPQYASQIMSAAQPYSGLTEMLSGAQTTLDAAAQNAAQTTAATAADVQNKFAGQGGVLPTFQDQMNQTIQGNQAKGQAFNSEMADVMNRLNSAQALTPQEQFDVDKSGGLNAVNPFGTSTGAFQNILAEGMPGFGPNFLEQYFTPADQVGAATAANSLTGDQRSEAAALNQLMGSTQFQLPQQGVPFNVPASPGHYDDQGMYQGIYNQLQSDQSYLPSMTPSAQNSYLADIQNIAGYLGMPTPGNPNPTPPPAVTNPTPSGPPYLAPVTQPLPNNQSQQNVGGGFHTAGI